MPCCDTGRNIQKYKGAAASTLQDVTDNGNTTTGDIITTTGYFIGDGSKLTGISGASAAFTLQETSDRGNTTSNVIQFTNTITSFTTSGNVTVAGNVTASSFYGLGSGLSSLNASNISSGTLSNDRLDTKTGTGNIVMSASPTLSGTITGGTFSGTHTGTGSGLSSLNASNISSGTLSNDRLDTKTGTANIVMSASPTLSGTITGGTFSGTHTGTGSGLSSLNASNISSGTLSNDRLDTKTGTGNIVMSASPTLSGTITGGTFSGTHTGTGSGLSSLNASNISSGTLSISRGGTNITTYTKGDILIASATDTLSNLSLGTGGYVLTSNSTSGLPEWKSSSDLGTEVAQLSNSSYILGGAYNGIASKVWSVQASTSNTADYIVARDSSGDIFVSNVNAINIRGDGSGIRNSNASNISLGTLAVARGGTGTTTSTGSGSVVLNTSPTFSGTVQGGTFSGSGSGLTSLNAGNISTGTLPVARGGTGATTLNNLIQMGTHTTGNYVATITGGNGIESTGATSGESITHTLSVDTKANGGLVIQNNQLAVDLSASAITGTLAVSDGGTNITSYAKGDILIASATNTLSNLSLGTSGYVLTSNSTSGLPEWRSASDIGTTVATLNTGNYLTGGPYNGSSTITFNVEGTTTNTPSNLVARDSSGDIYVQRVIVGTGSTGTLSSSAWSGSAAKLTTPRTIGGVSFDGSTNINLPGVNTTGNQNTTGSAAKLTTPRTIGGVSFDGSADINLPGVNTIGNQNTTGSAAKISVTNSTSSSQLPLPFMSAANGDVTLYSDSGALQYQASTGTLSSTQFNGSGTSLTGLNATNINNGTLSNAYGGTGFTSYNQGDLLVGTGSGSKLKKLSKGDANYVLTVNSLGNDIEWAAAYSSIWTQSDNDIYYDGGNVGIANTAPIHTLDVGSNVAIIDDGIDKLVIRGNVYSTNDIIASSFEGNGSKLTGVIASSITTEASRTISISTVNVLGAEWCIT